MAFTPVATTDTLETFRTRYNATNITLVDDSSSSVDITLATDSLKISGGTGTASVISGDTLTLNLSNTGVSAGSVGSSTAIPVLAINAQGQITSASTASISTDLTLVDDASTAATISLATDTLKISGGTGTTSAVSGDTLTINLDNTAVSAGSFGSSTAIPVLAIDAQGRVTGASTASISTDLTIVDDSSTAATISLASDTLKLAGGAGISTSISGDVVTIAKSSGSAHRTLFKYTATSNQTTFSGSDANSNTLAYSANNFDVFLNGVLLDASDFTASNGTSVVLASGAAASDILTVLAYQTESLIQNDQNGSELILDVDGDTTIHADTDDQIDFKAGGTDTMHIINGKVGIGITAPTQSLHVKNTTSSGGLIEFDGQSNAEFGLKIQSNISSGNFEGDFANGGGVLDLFANSGTTSGGDILIARTQATAPVFIAKGNGKVGIGISAPTGVFAVSDGTVTLEMNPTGAGLGFIGTRTNHPIAFQVNASEEMRLEADGDLHVDGDVIAFSTTISDVALKSNIEVIPNALDKLDEIRGVTFTRHNGTISAGIIAQELEKVLPEAVKEKTLSLLDGETYKTVEYDAIHGLLIQAIKELKDEIRGNKQ